MLKKVAFWVFMLLIAAESPVFAQSDVERQSDVSEIVPLKSKVVARNLSLGITVVPVFAGLMARDSMSGYLSILVGLTFGPSAGLYYAGASNQAGGGILLRALGGGITYFGGVYLVWGSIADSQWTMNAGLGAVIIGGAIMIGSALHDTFTRAPRAVREFNRKHDISLSPWVSPDTGTPGLRLNVWF